MIEPLKDKFYGMDYPPLATKKKPDLEDVVEKVNELIDAVNKLNTKEEKPAGSLDEMAGYDPLANYKARLKERIKNAGGDAMLKSYVLDIIDEE